MHVMIVGSFRFPTLESCYRRSLERLGHKVSLFDTERARALLSPLLRQRVTARLLRSSYRAHELLSRRYNAAFVNQCREAKPDVVLIVYGYYLFPESILAVREMGIRVVAYQPDNPFPPHRSSVPEVLPTAAACDLYLIWSEVLAARLRAQGVRAKFFPFGWDPELTPYSATSTPSQSVVFVGGWDPERETFFEELLKHVPVEIWGPDYWATRTRSGSRSRKAWMGRTLSEREMAELSGRSAISLNLLRAQHKIDGQFDGVIMRTFEVPGAGGFLLATESGCATTLFEPGQTGAFFKSVDACAMQIDRYLTAPALRNEVAACSHNLVDTKHRYDHRSKELVDLIDSVPVGT